MPPSSLAVRRMLTCYILSRSKLFIVFCTFRNSNFLHVVVYFSIYVPKAVSILHTNRLYVRCLRHRQHCQPKLHRLWVVPVPHSVMSQSVDDDAYRHPKHIARRTMECFPTKPSGLRRSDLWNHSRNKTQKTLQVKWVRKRGQVTFQII